MISTILFDFGGTLDSDGGHWLDRFYAIYDQIGLGHIPKGRIKEAFYQADALAEADLAMRTAGFREMVDRHIRWQFEHLGLRDTKREADAAAAFYRPAERVLHRNRNILEQLKQSGYQIGVISNFYGNVETLCREAGIAPLLKLILDSAVVGLRKPDVEFFMLALNKLGVPADQVAMVGDSFERDLVPAKALGMKTFWMAGDTDRTPPDPSKVDGILHSLEDLPRLLIRQFAPPPEGAPPRSPSPQMGEGLASPSPTWGEGRGEGGSR